MFLTSIELIVLIIVNPITYLNNLVDHYESYSSTGTVLFNSSLSVFGKYSSVSKLILVRLSATVADLTVNSLQLLVGLKFAAFAFTFWLRLRRPLNS